jgi:hypothetical protein
VTAVTSAGAASTPRAAGQSKVAREEMMRLRTAVAWVGMAAVVAAVPATADAARVVVVRAPVLRVIAGPVVVERGGHGRLHVEVEPERARVYLDGRYVGRGDVTRALRAGRHVVRVVLNDGREAAQTVHVDAGRVTRARLEL